MSENNIFKQIIAGILAVVLILSMVASIANAQITGGPIGTPSFWVLNGTTLSPTDNTNWDVDITTLNVGSIAIDTVAQGSITTGFVVATSTTATSTFAGGLTVDTSDFVVDPDAGRVGIGTADPSYLLQVASLGVNSSSQIVPGAAAGATDTSDGSWRVSTLWTGNNNQTLALQNRTYTRTVGTQNGVNLITTVQTTSGTLQHNALNVSPVINQTGGASGITRALYINPTLTSAADFRAIEVVSGDVLFNTTSGNVGIGTTTPVADLTISSVAPSITLDDTGDASAWDILNDNGDLEFREGYFGSSPTSRVYFQAGGNVGIGQLTPDGKLHVYSGNAGSVTAEGEADDLIVENSTSGGMSILVPDASNANIRFGSPTTNSGALLRWNYNDALLSLGANKADGELRFLTGSFSEAMRIDSSGNVGVGSTTPWRTLSVDGTVSFNGLTSSGTGNAVCITADNDITDAGGAICTPSSERFKENILSLDKGYALNVLGQLRPVSFDYKNGYYNEEDGRASLGLIAEEVAEVDTRLVDYEENGKVRTLYFERFTGIFTQAINELYGYVKKIASLALSNRDRIDTLEAENEALRARLEVIEAQL